MGSAPNMARMVSVRPNRLSRVRPTMAEIRESFVQPSMSLVSMYFPSRITVTLSRSSRQVFISWNASSSCLSCSFSFNYGDTLYFLIFCQHCFYFFYNLFLLVRKGYDYHFPKLPPSLFGKTTEICRMPCISTVSKYPFLIVTDSFCKTFQSIFQQAPGACNIHSDKGISVFPILPSF